MIDVSGLRLSLDAGLPENHADALREIAQQLGIEQDALLDAQLMKQSVDARKKSNVHFIATYRLTLPPNARERLLDRVQSNDVRLKGLQITLAQPYEALAIPSLRAPACCPVIVGAGPAGLFAAWYLAQCGLKPLLVEQGAPVDERICDVRSFFETGKLDPWSNIQFGEGGAGTFSDGKLTTNTKNRFTAHVLHLLVEAGAPESILWQAHPHMGSDNLSHVVSTIRRKIIAMGGEVRFHTQLSDMAFKEGRLNAIELTNMKTDETTWLACEALVLACGHSARQTFELVQDKGFAMQQKPFSIGVRIEHPQAFINKAQWAGAAHHPALGAAEYKLAIHLPGGRSVYSFCMCPGGEVVAAASEEGGIVTNGMSDHDRKGKNANAALLVNVDPTDFASDEVLAGMDLQREIEQRAYHVSQRYGGAPYQAPAQSVGSFLTQAKASGGVHADRVLEDTRSEACRFCAPTYERGVVAAPLDDVLPRFVSNALREALPIMGKKIKGFDDPRAIMTAPETRSSSPVRICRDESLQAYFVRSNEQNPEVEASGLYPCGEGPGFAGGIMSAAVDGLKVAQQVATRYQTTESRSDDDTIGTTSTLFDRAVRSLEDGEAVLFPTDTVYGLGVAVKSCPSPAILYRLKSRSEDKPIAWLIGSADDLETYGKNIPAWARSLASRYWPGALTLVVEASDQVPAAFQSAEATIALRVPDHELVRELVKRVGPIATTSANHSGDKAPSCLEEVPDEFRTRLCTLVGETGDGQASCVIDCTTEKPRIIRSGALDATALFEWIEKDDEQRS
jgi:tRNA threonylcarbamoyl adenosine modification protein (Sua5/YciO/YrdC/YwlC family)